MTWSEAFAAYLKRHNIKASTAAELLRVSPGTIHNWVVKHTEPRGKRALEIRRAVEIWSCGEVPASPWRAPEESGTDVAAFAAKAG